METFRELVRLSKIGEATENALNILNSRIVVDEPNWTLVIATSTEELLEWNKNRNAKVQFYEGVIIMLKSVKNAFICFECKAIVRTDVCVGEKGKGVQSCKCGIPYATTHYKNGNLSVRRMDI